MAQFRFRFETLLHRRSEIEDQRQRELAQLMRSRMIFLDQLASMQRDISGSKRRLADTLVGRVDLSRVGQFARFSGQATIRGRQLVSKLAELERHIVGARARLIDAVKQRRALELLRDRDREAWEREQRRRETAELDEIAVQRYARRAEARGVIA